MDINFRNAELRKLPPRYRSQLAQLLDVNEDWKKLMASIPSERDSALPKYTVEHIGLVERHGFSTRKSCAEILLDEWSTSGRKRPTSQSLYDLLLKCHMFRAADYVAQELLDTVVPERPSEGPPRRVDPAELTGQGVEGRYSLDVNNGNDEPTRQLSSTLSKVMEQLNNYDYQQGNLINFSIQLLKQSTKNFDQSFHVGSGSFGSVYKLELGSQFKCPPLAVKLLNQATTVMEDQFVTEINVLSKYKHENIVTLIGFSSNGPQFCLIYEFVPGGTLMESLAGEGPHRHPSWSKRMQVANGVIKGIHYLHTSQEPLIHRDIKSSNILLTRAGQPKIGDFGLAKATSGGQMTSAIASTIFGTSPYMSPEAFRGDISPKMDIFSFGVVLLEILTGLPPFDEHREGGCDIVTYIEDNVEDDDISPYLDEHLADVEPEAVQQLYAIAMKCLADKKQRLTSQVLLILLQEFDSTICEKNL